MIADVAQRLGARLKRIGPQEYAGPCPVCGGRDRFSVNTQKEVWNCRYCGIGGDQIDLVRHVLGLGFVEARQFVTGDCGSAPRRAAEGCRPPLQDDGAHNTRASETERRVLNRIGERMP